MNLIELNQALRQLRLGGIAAVLETRLRQAQVEPMAPIDFLSCLVSDELMRRGDRLLRGIVGGKTPDRGAGQRHTASGLLSADGVSFRQKAPRLRSSRQAAPASR